MQVVHLPFPFLTLLPMMSSQTVCSTVKYWPPLRVQLRARSSDSTKPHATQGRHTDVRSYAAETFPIII